MSNSEQNGRQSRPAPQQTAPPSDPRIRNAIANANAASSSNNAPPKPSNNQNEGKEYCKDYVWGICTMGRRCKYLHELDYEFMKSTLHFCHDYQNRQGCNDPDCTYLHTSREEEKLFLTAGHIPRVLADRYAAIASMSVPNRTAEQSAPMMGCGMYEYMAQPPPPPPLPASASQQSLLLVRPPPPPPPTTSMTPPRMSAPIYTAPLPMATAASVPFSPRPALPEFDPSRPPPPLPPNIRGTKRPAESREAGSTCKARKMDDSNDSLCEMCIKRALRIELYRQEIEKLQREEDLQRMILESKTEEYENIKLLMKSLVSPEIYRLLVEYIEMTASPPPSHSTSFGSPSSSSNDLRCQLLDNMVGRNSPSQEDTVLQTLASILRRSNNVSNNSSTESLQNFLALLRNTPRDDDSPPSARVLEGEGSRSTASRERQRVTVVMSRVSSTVSNGINGQRTEAAPPPPNVGPRLNTGPIQAGPLRPYLPPAESTPAIAGPSRPYLQPADGSQQAASIGYAMYPPAMPPTVNRPYYAYPYPSAPHNVPSSYGAPGANMPPRQPPPVRGPPQNYPQYLNRFPPPP